MGDVNLQLDKNSRKSKRWKTSFKLNLLASIIIWRKEKKHWLRMRILASRPVVIRESGRKWDRTKSVPRWCMVSWKARMIINISGFLPDSVDGLKIPCAIFAWLSRPQKHSTPSLPRRRSQGHGRHSFFREVHYITSTKRPRFCTSPTNSTLLWYTRPFHRINHFGRPWLVLPVSPSLSMIMAGTATKFLMLEQQKMNIVPDRI